MTFYYTSGCYSKFYIRHAVCINVCIYMHINVNVKTKTWCVQDQDSVIRGRKNKDVKK